VPGLRASARHQRIGDIVRTTQERGWDKNTWFIYTSDHGEMQGQAGIRKDLHKDYVQPFLATT
jgi:arylsulfatase A-like enzyme